MFLQQLGWETHGTTLSSFLKLFQVGMQVIQALRGAEDPQNSTPGPQSFTVFVCWNSPFLNTKGGTASHTSDLQKELHEKQAALGLAFSKHTCIC